MTQTGEMIENPVTHDRVIFRKTAQDTNGALLAFDDFLLAGYISPPEHVHPYQQEHFEALSKRRYPKVGSFIYLASFYLSGHGESTSLHA
jgi:hypothetical protein